MSSPAGAVQVPTAAQAWLEASSDHALDVHAGQLKQALVLAEGQAPSPVASSHYELDGEGWYGRQANQDLVRLVAGALTQKTSLHITTRVRQLLLCCLSNPTPAHHHPDVLRPPPHTSCQDPWSASKAKTSLMRSPHLLPGLASSHAIVLSTLLVGHEPTLRRRAGCITLSLGQEASRETGALADWHGGAAAPLRSPNCWLAQRSTCCLAGAWS